MVRKLEPEHKDRVHFPLDGEALRITIAVSEIFMIQLEAGQSDESGCHSRN